MLVAPVRPRATPGLTGDADRMIEFFRLAISPTRRPAALSYGQQKLLDAAMAFMAGPRLVLLDEPAGGVNLTMLATCASGCEAINARARRDLRRDRAQHGIRHGAVHAHPGAGRGPHHRRGRSRRACGATRR